MILKKLRLQAFGPFKKYFEINFDSLNKSGIFLLTGETGVGKTSIFDAIIYALYGEVCGTNQDLEKVRSDYASEDIITYVELEFEINGKLYFIRREPQQYVLGKGNKIVNRQHTVVLRYDDKSVVGPKEVINAVENLLGLKKDQFRQIVMIPQGEFMKLLTSSSEEKVKIFRHIFGTKKLEELENLIWEKSKELYGEVADVKNQMDIRISNLINVDKTLSYDIKIEKINEKIKEFEETRNSINEELNKLTNLCNEFKEKLDKKQALNDSIDEYKKNEDEFNKLKLNKEEIEFKQNKIEKSEKAYKIDSVYKRIKDVKEAINSFEKKNLEANKLIDEANNGLKENEKDYQDIIQLDFEYKLNKEKLIKAKEDYKKVDEYNSINSRLEEISIAISSKRKRRGEIDILEGNYLDRLNMLEIDLKEMNELINNEIHYTSKKISLEALIDKYKNYSEYQKQALSLDSLINECANKIQELYTNELNIDDEITNTKRRLLEDKAYVLALELEEGKPCPVCGSIRHPRKALPSDIEVNDDTLMKLEEDKKSIASKVSEAIAEKNKLFSEKSNYERLMDSLNITYSDEEYNRCNIELAEAIDMISVISDKKQERELILKTKNELELGYKDLVDEQKQLSIDLNDSEKEIEKLSAKVEMLSIDESIDYKSIISDLEEKIDSYENRVKDNREEKITLEAQIKMSLHDINVYSDNLIDKDKELHVLENELERIGLLENYESYLLDEELVLKYKEAIKEYNEKHSYYVGYFNRNSNLKGKEKEDLDKLKEIVDENDKARLNKTEELTEYKVRLSTFNQELRIIENLKNQSNKKIELQERLQRLAKISNGDNRLKMSFEKYVLAIYFEDVIKYANDILRRLTDRYILVRRDTLAKGNSQQGLDIDVYDFDTSVKRSVKTLSGGETFKASLSLALGLSEMIKQRKSIIDINTMFIDEGFGTLDNESLDNAINMLCGLKDQGLKIGIISHVSELKSRIDSKIVITRTNDGSNVKVVGE